MENGPAGRWSCFKSLKRLDIRRLGVVEFDLDHWDNATRIERNREAFRKIQKRIRMLPNLKELTVSVFGADEELIQGFLWIEDQDKEESEGARSSEVTEDADEIFGCERSRVGTRAAAAALAALVVSRTLVGPLLVSLTIWGLKQGGLVGNEIDRFLKNYPDLETVNTLEKKLCTR
ncbi:hypothetical protein BGX33_010371 [Mortierella sp. NVP41]|nr:hypothetical protein BGX33_010371 [Mortierella sp. NVP41]